MNFSAGSRPGPATHPAWPVPLPSRPPWPPPAPPAPDFISPAELLEPVVSYAEMMADLVDDGTAHLVDDLPWGPADSANRPVVDRDPVGQYAGILRRAAGERNSLVEPEQSGRPGPVLDHDRHVLHHPA